MASIAAVFTTSGTSKSGSPIDRLIGSFILAARSKTLRIPEASTAKARFEMGRGMGMVNVKPVVSEVEPWKMERKTTKSSHFPFTIFHGGRRRHHFFSAAGAAAFAAGAAPLAAGAGAPLAPAAGAAPALPAVGAAPLAPGTATP